MQRHPVPIDQETLEVQREARNYMKSKVRIMLVAFFSINLLLFILVMVTNQDIFAILLFAFLLAFTFIAITSNGQFC